MSGPAFAVDPCAESADPVKQLLSTLPAEPASPNVEALQQFLREASLLSNDGTLTLANGKADHFEVRLRDPAACHEYEITVGGRTFKLTHDEMMEWLGLARLGATDAIDTIRFVYGDTPVTDATTHSGGVVAMFALATQFGYQPTASENGAGADAWAAMRALQLYGRKRRLSPKDVASLPASVQTLVKHSVRVGLAGGTIVQLPDGRLGIVTARHVTIRTPWDDPERSNVFIGDRVFSATLHMPPYNDANPSVYYSGDHAVLTFSPDDERALRKLGFTGIPIVESGAGPTRHDPIVSAGYGASESGQGPTLNTGVVYTLPSDGEDRSRSAVERYNCDDRYTLQALQTGLWSTTAQVIPGDSGSGLFWFNPETRRFELVGVHHSNTGSLTHVGGVHENINRTLVEQWLRAYRRTGDGVRSRPR